ncbi:hypothetical protein P0082_05410 [Candidatus Haliotispira prima]|uniref:ComF family protein n=1 Tax=Candidatus Haliotispira prima TaxID=3034016 RepID=A0ABY8MM89_9SPIO|nr:hypothetical protein P0082_05410 [Candidatus Haliotispira prima]
MQQAWACRFAGYHLVPVPPRAAKLKHEAWDQVDYLCTFLHRRYRLPVLKLLQRNATAEQKHLNREQRLEQLSAKRKYSLALPARRLVRREFLRSGPLHLLLLDDIYTTGSTMDMCRRALLPLEQEGWIADIRSMSLCLVL